MLDSRKKLCYMRPHMRHGVRHEAHHLGHEACMERIVKLTRQFGDGYGSFANRVFSV
jgi:hypothetical protein